MRSELEYINRHSNYVSVNTDMIKSFVNNMTKWEYSYWMEDLKSHLSEKECIIFAFICQSIIFCFWGSNNGNNYGNYIGSEEMLSHLKANWNY